MRRKISIFLLIMIAAAAIILSHNRNNAIRKVRGDPTVGELLKVLDSCNKVGGYYATENDKSARIPICKLNGAFYWTSGMTVDCDGATTVQCNKLTDDKYQDTTTLQTSRGEALDATTIPYIVIPMPSGRWNYKANNIEPGAVVAVIYNGKVRYGVFGDVGPEDIIGEVSYAMAESLGVDPDPERGGVGEADVTYIVFPGSHVSPAENPAAAVKLGKQLAKKLIRENQ